MALRHTFVIAAVGIGLPLAGVAAPAAAAAPHSTSPTHTTSKHTTSKHTTTPQCQGLLGCVVPIVSGLTGGLISTVPTVVHGLPTIVGSVPTTLSNLLGAQHHPRPPQGPSHPPKKPHHGKPVVKPQQHQKPPVTSAPHRVVAPARTATLNTPAPTAPKPTVVTAPAPLTTNPVTQVINEVAHVAHNVVSLFGWNLLALIPMAGIAFVISRRMSASRRSVSGLL